MSAAPEPLDHVIRPALPWRAGDDVTECGKPVAAVAQAITRDQALAKVRKQGKQRAAMSTCMTCWQTAEHNREWRESPTEVIAREARRNFGRWSGGDEGETQLDRELRALAALAEAHRDEFDDYLQGLTETTTLDEARAQRAARLRREAARRGGGTTL